MELAALAMIGALLSGWIVRGFGGDWVIPKKNTEEENENG